MSSGADIGAGQSGDMREAQGPVLMGLAYPLGTEEKGHLGDALCHLFTEGPRPHI